MPTHNYTKITIEALKDALNEWQSAPELGKNPLARLRIVVSQREAMDSPDIFYTRGQALRAVLREAIYTFPQSASKDQILTKAERPFYLLSQRYIEGNGWKYVAAQMGIARRTFFNEQARAIETLLEVLQEQEAAAISDMQPISHAFIDSHDEIVRTLNELPLDVIPDPAPLPSGSVMPLERNPLFVGREQDLLRLSAALKGGETVASENVEIAAITGVGGIGKTQLASEFVHRYGQFFSGRVFWLNFADAKTVSSEIAACGGPGRLDLHPNFSDLSLDDQLNLVQGTWQKPIPRLLVFDNCEDPELLQRWRPTSGGCRVLITSRRATWEPVLGVKPLQLRVLPRDESLVLLKAHFPAADVEPLNAIAEELGDLPLALHLAGRYLARYEWAISPATYLAQLQNPALLEHLSFEEVGLSPTRHVQNLYRTIALSFERLLWDSPADRAALQILAGSICLPPGERILRSVLIEAADLPEDHKMLAEIGLTRLLELGLLYGRGAYFRIHRLLTAFIREIDRYDYRTINTANTDRIRNSIRGLKEAGTGK